LLWLWSGPADIALIQSLAWELPYAVGMALKKQKKKKKKGRGEETETIPEDQFLTGIVASQKEIL